VPPPFGGGVQQVKDPGNHDQKQRASREGEQIIEEVTESVSPIHLRSLAL